MQVEGQRDEASALLSATGEWVSNTYPTWQLLRDSPAKVELIPYALRRRHLNCKKDLSVADGDASD